MRGRSSRSRLSKISSSSSAGALRSQRIMRDTALRLLLNSTRWCTLSTPRPPAILCSLPPLPSPPQPLLLPLPSSLLPAPLSPSFISPHSLSPPYLSPPSLSPPFLSPPFLSPRLLSPPPLHLSPLLSWPSSPFPLPPLSDLLPVPSCTLQNVCPAFPRPFHHADPPPSAGCNLGPASRRPFQHPALWHVFRLDQCRRCRGSEPSLLDIRRRRQHGIAHGQHSKPQRKRPA